MSLIPAIATWTDEDTGEVYAYKIIGKVDVYALAPDDQPRDQHDCATGYFQEWDVSLFGWRLTVAAGFDIRLSHWGLFCRWFRRDRAEMPRGWVWWGSCAALTLCLGPFAVDVSAFRTGPSGRWIG